MFLTVKPVHPFADLLLWQSAATAALGFAASAGLERLYALARRRFPRPTLAAAALLIASPSIALIWFAAASWAVQRIDPFERAFVALPGGTLFAPPQAWAFPPVLMLWSVLFVAVIHGLDRQAQRERLLRAEGLAHEARLEMLRYQLNPHFLFNALNSIAALADEAPARVTRMVDELSAFLRYSLLESAPLEAPLRHELEAAEHYLAVERVRFEDDLRVEIDVDDDAARIAVPAFILLPLVENAITHGRRTSASPLRVAITGRNAAEALSIEVANTGRWGADPSVSEGTGTGLANVRQRLAEHYGDKGRLDITEGDGWVRVRIGIAHEAS